MQTIHTIGLAFVLLGFVTTLCFSVSLGVMSTMPRANPRQKALLAFLALVMCQNAFVAGLIFSALQWGSSTWSVAGVTLLSFQFYENSVNHSAHWFTPLAFFVWPTLGVVAGLIINRRSGLTAAPSGS